MTTLLATAVDDASAVETAGSTGPPGGAGSVGAVGAAGAAGSTGTPPGAVVAAHLRHRVAWYAPLVGALRVSDRALPALTNQLDADPTPAPFPVSLSILGGAGAIGPALAWATRNATLQVRSVHARLRGDDLARGAARLVTALVTELPEGVDVHVEVPTAPGEQTAAGWSAALDAVAETGYALDVRTSGSWQHEHPDSRTLAAVLDAALDRELLVGFVGTNRALGGDHEHTGYREHGLLGLLGALTALLDGAAGDDAAAVLDDAAGDPHALGDAAERAVTLLTEADPVRLRRTFRGTAAADVERLADDLAALQLVGTRSPA